MNGLRDFVTMHREALKEVLSFEYYYIYGNLIIEYYKFYEDSSDDEKTAEYLASNDPGRDRVLDLIPRIFNAEGKKSYTYVEGQDGYESKEEETDGGQS